MTKPNEPQKRCNVPFMGTWDGRDPVCCEYPKGHDGGHGTGKYPPEPSIHFDEPQDGQRHEFHCDSRDFCVEPLPHGSSKAICGQPREAEIHETREQLENEIFQYITEPAPQQPEPLDVDERMELETLRADMHSRNLGDRPSSPSAAKLGRLIELESRSRQQPEPSELGAFWQTWFAAVGEHATVDVVNATTKLVIAEREIAVRDSQADPNVNAIEVIKAKRDEWQAAVHDCSTFMREVYVEKITAANELINLLQSTTEPAAPTHDHSEYDHAECPHCNQEKL